MPVNRSVRTLLAAGVLIAALFVAMDYAVEATPLMGWWLPLLLVIIGVVLVGSPRSSASDDRSSAAAATPTTFREYEFPALLSAAGPEEPGEINVREPVIDTEEDLETAVTPVVNLGNSASAEESARAEETAPDQPETPQEAAHMAGTEGPGIPTSTVKPDMPEVSSTERLQADGVVLQPADTTENELQNGEHVAHQLPSSEPSPINQTTGEGMGAGHAPIAPEQKAVLDTMAAPEQNQGALSASAPDVVDAIMNDRGSGAEAAALTKSEPVRSTPASGADADDLTIIHGIGPKIAASLKAAGIDSFTKLANAADADLDSAIRAGGVRLAPTLTTWREQAAYLASGDRDGFESLRRKLQQGGIESGD